jgi:hypothetical protein
MAARGAGSPAKFIVSVMPVLADKAPEFISAAAGFFNASG